LVLTKRTLGPDLGPASDNWLLSRALLRPAKTGADVTVLEHLSHTLQVLDFLCRSSGLDGTEVNRLRLATALHDIGKAVTQAEGRQWRHARAGADLLPSLLSDNVLAPMLREAGIVIPECSAEVASVARLIAEHHGLTMPTCLETPAAPLMVVADGVASALEEGWAGTVASMVRGSAYHRGALSVAEATGLSGHWDKCTIHRVEMPADTISELLLAERVTDILKERLVDFGAEIVVREAACMWIATRATGIEAILEHTTIATGDVLDRSELAGVYVRPGFPRVPMIDTRSLEFLLIDDATATTVLRDVLMRRGAATATILESQGLTFDTLTADLTQEGRLDPNLVAEALYAGIRAFFIRHAPQSEPLLCRTAAEAALGNAAHITRDKDQAVALVRKAHPRLGADAAVIGNLISRSSSARSITNVLYARRLALQSLQTGAVSFRLSEVAYVDGTPLVDAPDDLVAGHRRSKVPCACCALRPAAVAASSLVMGPTEGDGLWASAGGRKKSRICGWCHSAGIADLSIAAFRMDGRRRVRETNYLLVRSALSREVLESVLFKLGLVAASHLADETMAEAPDASEMDLIDALLGTDPGPESALGVRGALAIAGCRGVHATVLPGNTPLATQAVFALPSASFFGLGASQGVNQGVLDLLALGLVDALASALPGTAFAMRATTCRSRVSLRGESVEAAELAKARICLELAELRRELARQVPGLQSPDAVDVGFVLMLQSDPRRAAASLIRDLMRTPVEQNDRIVRRIVDLVSRTLECPATVRARALTASLQAFGLLKGRRGVMRRTRSGGWDARSELDMIGPMLGLWRVGDADGWRRWAATHAAGLAPAPRTALETLVLEIPAIEAGAFARMMAHQAPLLVIEATLARLQCTETIG
jgi:hypothetical protein